MPDPRRLRCVHPVDLDLHPLDALARWPTRRPIFAMTIPGQHEPGRARWTVLALPTKARPPAGDAGLASARPQGPVLGGLDELIARHATDAEAGVCLRSGERLPMVGGLAAVLPYELGEALEPACTRGPMHPRRERSRGRGSAVVLRLSAGLIYDHDRAQWTLAGEREGCDRLAALVVPRLRESASVGGAGERLGAGGGYRLGRARSAMGRRAFESAAARAVELIHAGDVFQVNLAHRLDLPFVGSTRGLAIDLWRSADPAMGCYAELPARRGEVRAVVSASPELFVRSAGARAGMERWIETRPIKGTRPGEASEADLLLSEKDQAELAMIVDLMRNDLGRVCERGTVRVQTDASGEWRAIERHARGAGPGVLHSVATVRGVWRAGVTLEEVLRATFPPGSITGAPKVRAMQIIRELEPTPRGPYCGSCLLASDAGDVHASVAIRTGWLRGRRVPRGETVAPGGAGAMGGAGSAAGVLHFGVGAGIVAQSEPAGEWRETLVKARTVLSLVNEGRRRGAGTGLDRGGPVVGGDPDAAEVEASA